VKKEAKRSASEVPGEVVGSSEEKFVDCLPKTFGVVRG